MMSFTMLPATQLQHDIAQKPATMMLHSVQQHHDFAQMHCIIMLRHSQAYIETVREVWATVLVSQGSITAMALPSVALKNSKAANR